MQIFFKATVRRLLVIALTITVCGGCGASKSATFKGSPGKYPPANVSLGPVLKLGDSDVVKLSGTMDNTGRAHLLVAKKSPKDIDYLVIESDNRIHREHLSGFSASTFLGFAYGLKLDIAIDPRGRIRAIVEDNALILEEGIWKQAGNTPCRKYVRAGDTFYCVFISPGKDVGASRQLEWFGFGGYPGGGIIFPWPSYPKTLVVLREDGEKMVDMAAIDPDRKGDVDALALAMAGDSTGSLHLAYRKSWALVLTAIEETRYIRLPTVMDGEYREYRKEDNNDNLVITRYRGTDVPVIGGGDISLAADPASGTAILVVKGLYEDENTPLLYSRIVREGKFEPPRPLPLKEGNAPTVAPAGSGDFHLSIVGNALDPWSWNPTFPIYYLSYEDDTWSSPLELGVGSPQTEKFLLVSDTSRRAFVAWATPKGLEGRWVELEKRNSRGVSP